MSDIVGKEHLELARQARETLSAYRESADLVEVGAYVAGTNPRLDRALKCIRGVEKFLRQDPNERFALVNTIEQLRRAVAPGEQTRA
jgi:flagellum-specific ATP synthase